MQFMFVEPTPAASVEIQRGYSVLLVILYSIERWGLKTRQVVSEVINI